MRKTGLYNIIITYIDDSAQEIERVADPKVVTKKETIVISSVNTEAYIKSELIKSILIVELN